MRKFLFCKVECLRQFQATVLPKLLQEERDKAQKTRTTMAYDSGGRGDCC